MTRPRQKTKKKPRRRTAKRTPAQPLIPQPHGGALQVGNPGNSGGPGRPPEEFRRELARIRDTKGVAVLTRILDGKIPHTIAGRCSHCKKMSVGLDASELTRLIPGPETQARVAGLTLSHTLPAEHVVRLDGPRGAAIVFEEIKAAIRLRLPRADADDLISTIHRALVRRREPLRP